MLFRGRFLDGIRHGAITLAFRRWNRPTVKSGGRLRTAIGVLAIGDVRRIPGSDISEADARAAGYEARTDLLRELDRRPAGDIYRIELAFAGPDPRVALRDQAQLTTADLDELHRRLARLDGSHRDGAWTDDVLRLIDARPGVLAATLAASLGRETLPFKRDVRKLKELGLTESLEVGYRLSPRGQVFLSQMGAGPRQAHLTKKRR